MGVYFVEFVFEFCSGNTIVEPYGAPCAFIQNTHKCTTRAPRPKSSLQVLNINGTSGVGYNFKNMSSQDILFRDILILSFHSLALIKTARGLRKKKNARRKSSEALFNLFLFCENHD